MLSTIVDGYELITNSNLEKVLNVATEVRKSYIFPAALREEIDDLGFVQGCLFIASSRRSTDEVLSGLSYGKSIAGVEFSLNKRALLDYMQEPSIPLSDAFGLFLAAARHAKKRSMSLGVRSVHCGFAVPIEVRDVVRSPHHAIWTLFRGGGEPAYDPQELENFELDAMAHLIM